MKGIPFVPIQKHLCVVFHDGHHLEIALFSAFFGFEQVLRDGEDQAVSNVLVQNDLLWKLVSQIWPSDTIFVKHNLQVLWIVWLLVDSRVDWAYSFLECCLHWSGIVA